MSDPDSFNLWHILWGVLLGLGLLVVVSWWERWKGGAMKRAGFNLGVLTGMLTMLVPVVFYNAIFGWQLRNELSVATTMKREVLHWLDRTDARDQRIDQSLVELHARISRCQTIEQAVGAFLPPTP